MTTESVRLRVLAALFAVAVLFGVLPSAEAGIGEGGDAIDRQLLVYEINLARWNPVEYAGRSGISWDGMVARPPLVLNDQLLDSSQSKADEMGVHGYFAHQSAVTGLWPNEIARSAGYPLSGEFRVEANNIESLHSGSPVAFDVLGSFAKSPTHRRHIFGMEWFTNHREIGVGRSLRANFWSVHTAFRDEGVAAITGVVFDDANGNSRMDWGEGLPGVAVTAGRYRAVTNAGGGYVLQVGPGSHTVSAEGGAFLGASEATVTVADYNVSVDFVSGAAEPQVRAYQRCEGLEPTILGTAGDDVLIGTPGRDIIHGLGGDDVIDGLGGDDVICRGAASLTPIEASMEMLSILRRL